MKANTGAAVEFTALSNAANKVPEGSVQWRYAYDPANNTYIIYTPR